MFDYHFRLSLFRCDRSYIRTNQKDANSSNTDCLQARHLIGRNIHDIFPSIQGCIRRNIDPDIKPNIFRTQNWHLFELEQ